MKQCTVCFLPSYQFLFFNTKLKESIINELNGDVVVVDFHNEQLCTTSNSDDR